MGGGGGGLYVHYVLESRRLTSYGVFDAGQKVLLCIKAKQRRSMCLCIIINRTVRPKESSTSITEFCNSLCHIY